MGGFKPIEWKNGRLYLLDQTLLPTEEFYLEISTFSQLKEAISSLRVRGAPAIGVAAAFGLVLAVKEVSFELKGDWIGEIKKAASELVSTRPTAVNLKKAVEQMMEVVSLKDWEKKELVEVLEKEAKNFFQKNLESDLKVAEHGISLIQSGDCVLTHCNTGALATGGYGTALGVIKKAFEEGKEVKVFVDETRPLLQGSRLTAWELDKIGIDYEVIVDSAAGFLMAQGEIDKVIVGADRVVLNGDTANKIGTYSLAVLAHYHRIPFYVAAPLKTFDFEIEKGDLIPIEERGEGEVTKLKGIDIAPVGTRARNPAFDVTPSNLISAFITERGLIFPPYEKNIPKFRERN